MLANANIYKGFDQHSFLPITTDQMLWSQTVIQIECEKLLLVVQSLKKRIEKRLDGLVDTIGFDVKWLSEYKWIFFPLVRRINVQLNAKMIDIIEHSLAYLKKFFSKY